MKQVHYLVLGAAFAVACADSPTAYSGTTIGGYPPPAPSPSTAVLSGRILVSGIGSDRIVELRDDHGDVFRLLGNETIALANVDSGDAVVWGTWDANPGFVVSEFKVIGMYGRPALDGVLEANDEGFALRFADGSFKVVPYLTSDCAAYLGARIWVVGFEDGTEVQYGVIAGAESH
jgi:hypothetical protein